MTRLVLPEMPSSALASSGRFHTFRTLARILGLLSVLTIIALPTVPWQQSIRGSGRVVAYAPLDRQQSVEAPIEGRVVKWYVQEGSAVKAGDPIADISDNDPEIISRIRREEEASKTQVLTAQQSITFTESNILSLQIARDSAIENAKQKVDMAEQRFLAAQNALDAALAGAKTAELNLTRQQRLFEKGLSSKRELELAELDDQRSHNEAERAQASLRAARAEVSSLKAEQTNVASSRKASIESAQSSLEKLKADKAKAEAELAKVEVRLARQGQMNVVAPRDGTILRVIAKQATEMVKQGDPLVVLVPNSEDRAVEFYVNGNDAPLLTKGTPVRLQFEGWPAVQFVGWPSAAIGTFPAKVDFVDAQDDGQGRFRALVVPEKAEDWPSTRYLRQGVRANGWALLNRVSIGFELWRQFNGFPPSLEKPHGPSDGKDSAKEKEKTP